METTGRAYRDYDLAVQSTEFRTHRYYGHVVYRVQGLRLRGLGSRVQGLQVLWPCGLRLLGFGSKVLRFGYRVQYLGVKALRFRVWGQGSQGLPQGFLTQGSTIRLALMCTGSRLPARARMRLFQALGLEVGVATLELKHLASNVGWPGS